jgi:hypothetical protein
LATRVLERGASDRSRDSRSWRDSRGSRGWRESRDSRDSRDSRESRDSRGWRESRDSRADVWVPRAAGLAGTGAFQRPTAASKRCHQVSGWALGSGWRGGRNSLDLPCPWPCRCPCWLRLPWLRPWRLRPPRLRRRPPPEELRSVVVFDMVWLFGFPRRSRRGSAGFRIVIADGLFRAQTNLALMGMAGSLETGRTDAAEVGIEPAWAARCLGLGGVR